MLGVKVCILVVLVYILQVVDKIIFFLGSFISFFRQNIYWCSWPALKLCLFLSSNSKNSLFVLDIGKLPVTWLANILSHCLGCLFTLLPDSFAGLKLLDLISRNLFTSTSVDYAHNVICLLKIAIAKTSFQELFLVFFSSRSLRTFRSYA